MSRSPYNTKFLEEWEQEAAQTYERRKIITGNLLKGFAMKGDAAAGAIVTFTKSDGGMERGILLSRNSKINVAHTPILANADMMQRLWENGVHSFMSGEITVRQSGENVVVSIPVKGGKEMAINQDLADLMINNEMEKRGDAYVGYVPAGDAHKLIDYLEKSQGGFKVRRTPEIEKIVSERPSQPSDGIIRSERGITLNPAWAAVEAGKAVVSQLHRVASSVATGLESPEEFKSLVEEYVGNRNIGYERVEGFVAQVKRFIGKDEDLGRAITIYLQLNDAPEYLARVYGELPAYVQHSIDRMWRFTPMEKAMAKSIEAWYLDLGELAIQADVIGTLREFYSPGYWFGKKGAGRAAGKFKTTSPHAKGKRFDNYIEGILAGYKPRSLNVADHLRRYGRDLFTVMSARNFLTVLKQMVMQDGRRALEYEFREGTQDYRSIDHPAFRKHKYIATDEMGQPILYRVPLVAHPSIYPHLRALYQKSFFDDYALLRFIKRLNLMQKLGKVRFGLFHWTALSRQALAYGFSPTDYAKGLSLIEQRDPDVELCIRYGATLSSGEMEDYTDQWMRGIEDTALETAEGAPEKARKLIKSVLQSMDRGLWHKFFRGLKATALKVEFNRNRSRYPNKSTEDIARITATDINDVFGGLNWEMLGISRTIKDIMRLFLFAPDWTASNWRSFLRPIIGGGAGGGGRKGMSRFFLRGMLMFGLVQITMNRVLSGHWPWENEKGRRWYVDTGFKNDRGQVIYWNPYGHFIEPIKALTAPVFWAKGKMGILMRYFYDQFVGTDWRGRPFGYVEDLMDGYLYAPYGAEARTSLDLLRQAPARGIEFVRTGVPIPMDAFLMWVTGQEEFPQMLGGITGERVSKGTHGDEFVRELREFKGDYKVDQARARRKAKDHIMKGDMQKAILTLMMAGYADPGMVIENIIFMELAPELYEFEGTGSNQLIDFIMEE